MKRQRSAVTDGFTTRRVKIWTILKAKQKEGCSSKRFFLQFVLTQINLRKTASRTQLGRGICKLVTLFDDISTVIHQHDLHCQLIEGLIDEEDKEFAYIEKDEIDAKKRESVTFVDKSSNLLI